MKAVKIYETGCVRKNNEDAYLVLPEAQLFAVADGMGGHNGGEVASEMALEQLKIQADKLQLTELSDLQDWMIESINEANNQVYATAVSSPELEGMGTTVTALVIKDKKAVVGHVGDSRIYLWRDSVLSLLSEDHSMVNELVRLGQLTEEKAKSHPHKNVLSRALGVERNIKIDCFQLEIQEEDVFLLCTDGFSNVIDEKEIIEEFSILKSWEDSLENLKNIVLERGAPDNFTVVCCMMER